MKMNPLRRLSIRCAIIFPALLASGSIMAGDDQLQSGASYKIVRKIYVMGVYQDLDEKRVGKGAIIAYLHPEQYAITRWVAFQFEVPAGATMTIIGPAPPAKDLWRSYAAYHVKLDPDPVSSRKLDVIVQLFRGFDDASGGLSASFFERIN